MNNNFYIFFFSVDHQILMLTKTRTVIMNVRLGVDSTKWQWKMMFKIPFYFINIQEKNF
jgi:hypothetical protein